jgi:hypothetical protein
MAMQDYLYAVVDRLPRTWNPHLPGLVGVPVQATTIDDFVVVRSRLGVVPAASPKTLAAHHDVVASLMEAEAIVPFPFGTALAGDESDTWVASHATLLRTALAKVRGCVEMNVKLLRLNVSSVRRVGIEADERDPRRIAYLDALGERLVARAGVDDWRYCVQGNGSNVAASVAFLVPRLEVSDFLTRIAPIASRANGVAVVPTGPWPAYSFVPTLGDAPTADRLARVEPPEDAVHRRVS